MSSLWDALSSCIPGSTTRGAAKFTAANPYTLPPELWTEVIAHLEPKHILLLVRTSRTLNALAVPLYLARFGLKPADVHAGSLNLGTRPHLLHVVRMAFFLPPIINLSCAVDTTGRYEVLSYLTKTFLAAGAEKRERVELDFNLVNAFMGHGFHSRRRPTPERKMQRAVCALLNTLTPRGRTVLVFGHTGRTLLLDPTPPATRTRRWRVITQPMPPPLPGLRPHLGHALRIRRPPVQRDLTLFSEFSADGTVTRTSEVVDDLQSVIVHYNVGRAHSSESWSIVVINARQTRVYKLPPTMNALAPGITLTWEDFLPLLDFPHLEELRITSGTPFGSAPEDATRLHEISLELFDEFLLRLPKIEKLDYLPQLPPLEAMPPVGMHGFASLTHLTTTAIHFVHAFQAPECAHSLEQLRLIDVHERPVDLDVFLALLRILSARRVAIGCEALRLSIPASWTSLLDASTIPVELYASIDSVQSLHLCGSWDDRAGDIEPDARAILTLLPLFHRDSFTALELQAPLVDPSTAGWIFALRLADALRRQADWLESIDCVRQRDNGSFERKGKSKKRLRVPNLVPARFRRAAKDRARSRTGNKPADENIGDDSAEEYDKDA